MSFYQLGDNNTMFGIDNLPDYSWAGVSKLPEGSKSLVGVVNNEFGVKKVASPAIMMKALEEGVTHLDAFADLLLNIQMVFYLIYMVIMDLK